MHHPLFGFRYPYETHALTHHKTFNHDATYHLQRPEDASTIPMAAWNGIALVTTASIPPALLCLIANVWWPLIVVSSTLAVYYLCYEYMHWCMHKPMQRWFETTALFRRLNGHHVLHHRWHKKNLNVVLPFADLLFRTLLLRSPLKFKQPEGPSIPDLQPQS